MIGFLWRLLGRRLGWLVAGALGRMVLRTMTEREVDKLADQLDERLPSSVRAAAQRLPGDPVRSGAQAVVAGRSLRRAANGSARVARAANDGRRIVVDRAGAVGDIRQAIRRESDLAFRELQAQRLQVQGGSRQAADEVQLDVRAPEVDDASDPAAERDLSPLDGVPEAVAAGRRKGRRRPTELVQRVQRSYRPATRPWDR